MKWDRVQLTVYKAAFKAKLKKWILGKTDPYLPLPDKTFLSPSIGISWSYKTAERKLSFFKFREKPFQWQNMARKKLVEISGYDIKRPIPKIIKINSEQSLQHNLFKRSLYLRVKEKTDLPVHLIYSKNKKQPFPVFIFLAGTTSGVHIGWGSKVVPIDHQRVSIGADLASQAAKRGYLGVAIEQVGYGERGERCLWKRSQDRSIDASNHLLLLGKTLMGYGATEISSVLDWLLNSNKIFKIDKNRVFLFGHSSGGTLAQYASALDIRIKGTLASGSVGHITETIGSRGAAGGHNIIPGFLKWFNSADLLALNAPRPFVGLSGDKDHIFPFSGTKSVINEARQFYSIAKFKNSIKSFKVKGKHQYHSKETWMAWEKWIDPKS